MEKITRVTVAGEKGAAGLYKRLVPSSEANDKFHSLGAGSFNGGREIDQTLAQGKPIGLVVARESSWEACLGRPTEQKVDDTCALVACIVCLEAVHRFEYEKVHGEGTFPRTLVAAALRKLFQECRSDGTWVKGSGAYVSKVLNKIAEMRGILATTDTTPPRALPLRSWQKHRASDDAGLSPKRVATLLHSHGPCVGVVWVCPWYFDVDAGLNDTVVYRSGCGRNDDYRKRSKELYGDEAGSHAVVCFAYRFCGEEMHLLVRDNHDARANGPQRWIDVEELDTLYTLSVERLDDDPPLLPMVVPVRRSRRAIRPNPRVSGPEWTQ